MRILILNVRHGGGSRAQSIAEWCLGINPDFLVLTEWRDNAAGRVIRDALEPNGFRHAASATRSPRTNGVFVMAKTPVTSHRATPVESPAGELLLVTLQSGVHVLGCYFPQSMQKAPFFSRAAEFGVALKNTPFLLVGDLNTGRNDVDRTKRGVKFALEDDFISLSRATGLVDLWRQEHGERALEWSWLTAKNGFRIDHAFGNQALLDRFLVADCRYDHSPRNLGLSDHSAMVLVLAPK
jgi:exodeoxyribonuclease-3